MFKYLFVFVFLCVPLVAQSENITNNVINGCNTDFLDLIGGNANFVPDFIANQYMCNHGDYLPADTEFCTTCPDGFVCDGGIYSFNETKSQGIVYNNVINQNITNACSENMTVFEPVFYPTQYICTPGYYLGADDIECSLCPEDHYCVGGTYTFNETDDQGITACPTEHPFAPAGMWLASQCGRKLHVGNDVLYMHQQPAHPTIHRLYIGHPNGIYSANTVQRDMNSDAFPKMSEGMSKGLHVTIDNAEYLICDDSVPECLND